MKPSEDFKAMLRELLKSRGFIIVGIPVGVTVAYAVGDHVDKVFNLDVGAKFVVLAVAERVDWDEQISAIERLRPHWPKIDTGQIGYRFFKVKPLGSRKVVTM